MSLRSNVCRILSQVASAASLVFLLSCASIRVTRSEHPDTDDGIVFHPPKPHLVVSQVTDKDGKPAGFEHKILYLPDRAHARRMTWSSGLFGSVQPKIGLTDGWMLSSLDAKVDTGTSAAITALVGAADAVAFGSGVGLPVGIYPLEWKGDRYAIDPNTNLISPAGSAKAPTSSASADAEKSWKEPDPTR